MLLWHQPVMRSIPRAMVWIATSHGEFDILLEIHNARERERERVCFDPFKRQRRADSCQASQAKLLGKPLSNESA